MGYREDISESQHLYALEDFLNAAIRDTEYNNRDTGSLKQLQREIRNPFTKTGNIRHFED